MEYILGQPTRFLHCTRFTILTDELANLDSDVKIVVISCLTDIIETIGSTAEPTSALEKAMRMIDTAMFALCSHRGGSIKIFIAPCTPRVGSSLLPAQIKTSMVGYSI